MAQIFIQEEKGETVEVKVVTVLSPEVAAEGDGNETVRGHWRAMGRTLGSKWCSQSLEVDQSMLLRPTPAPL